MSGWTMRRAAIAASGLSIYDPVVPNRKDLFFPREELEVALCEHLRGRELPGENKTKAKLAKQLVAEALGYPVPSAFQRTSPRFTGQTSTFSRRRRTTCRSTTRISTQPVATQS